MGGMTFPRLRALLLMLRGHMVKPDPTVPPVDRPGDVHSRKVAPCRGPGFILYAETDQDAALALIAMSRKVDA